MLDTIYLAMKKGREMLIVGSNSEGFEGAIGEDDRTENFGAGRDALGGEGNDLVFKDREEGGDKL